MNRYGKFKHWGEQERIDHLHMCFDHASFSWLISNLHKSKKWSDLKTSFLAFFGKVKDDFVLEKVSAKKYALKDPNMFTCQVLDYLAASEPRANEIRKSDALYEALPRRLKIKFLEGDRPRSVEEFTTKLKRIARAIRAKKKLDTSDSDDSDTDDTKEAKTTQMFALIANVQDQVAKLTTGLTQPQNLKPPRQNEHRPMQQERRQTYNQQPAQPNQSNYCRYCKKRGHEIMECHKLAWAEQQPWYTGQINQRDGNGRIINYSPPKGNAQQINRPWQPVQPAVNNQGK